MAFAKSILKNESEGTPLEGRGRRSPTRPPGDLSAARPALHSLPAPPPAPPRPPDAPAEVFSDFKSDEEGVPPNERSRDLVSFQDKWDVDDECIEYIEKLPAEVQALVIKMYHRGDDEPEDPSDHCQDFARDVLEERDRRGSEPGVLQRPPCPRPPRPHSTREPLAYPGHRSESERRRSPPPPPLPAPPPPRPEGSRIRGREQRQDGDIDYNRSCRRSDSKSALNDFQAKWGVDDRCISYLASLPERVQAKVVEQFVHKPHHTNVSVRCMAFTRTVAERFGGADDNDERSCGAEDDDDELSQFQAKWGLSEECTSFLSTLPVDVLQKVITKFDHGPNQTNPSRRCMAFARSIRADDDELSQFKAKWGLSEECTSFLSTLPVDVLRKVLTKFDHGPNQTNPSRRCMAFAKSIK